MASMTEDNLPQRVWGKLAVWLIVPIAMITLSIRLTG